MRLGTAGWSLQTQFISECNILYIQRKFCYLILTFYSDILACFLVRWTYRKGAGVLSTYCTCTQALTSSLQALYFSVPDTAVGFQLLQGPYKVPAFLHSYGPGNSTPCYYPLEVTLMFCLKSLSGISAGAGTALQCWGYTKECTILSSKLFWLPGYNFYDNSDDLRPIALSEGSHNILCVILRSYESKIG